MGRHTNIGAAIERMDERIDLRRRRTRAEIDRIIRRAEWLDPPERELVLAYFEQGLSAARIGAICGLEPRQVRRRVRRLVERLNDPRVAYVVAHSAGWGRSRCAIGRELFVRGRSMREVSRRLGVSLHCVRRHRDAIEAMAQADLEERRPSRAWRRALRGEP